MPSVGGKAWTENLLHQGLLEMLGFLVEFSRSLSVVYLVVIGLLCVFY